MTDQELLQAMQKMIEQSERRMCQRIEQSEIRMCQRIEESEIRMGQRIEQSESRMGQRIEQSESRMGQMMDQKLEPLKADIEEIKESLDVVRSCTNSLIEWSEKVSMAVHFPLPAIDD